MRPRSERGILVGHAMGASAYIIHLPRMNKVVTSSTVVFDEIPTEIPFLTERPAHWTSPAPGVDDAAPVVAEEFSLEMADNNSLGQPRNSAFDGRDIPRPPAITSGNREVNDNQESTSAEEVVNISEGDRETVIRVGNDQLGTMFMDEDYTDHPDASVDSSNFALCMLANTGITVKEAMGGPDAEKWKDAIKLEDQGLDNLKVITREECPVGIRPLNTKYVLTKKRDPEGTVEHFKARRIVQGFHQVYGRDFLENFSPVVGFDTMRVVLKLAVNHVWELGSLDFTQAYLNAPLQETIYVKNLDGSTGGLNKALYGLKQAGYEWNKTLKEHILKRKCWEISQNDSCLLYAHSQGKIAIIATYVDDLLVTGSWQEEIEGIQGHVLDKFIGTVQLEPRSFLKLETRRNREGLLLHQSEYCRSIIDIVYQGPTRRVYVPLEKGADLTSRNEGENKLGFDKHPFRQIMGRLMYLAHMSRPDISNSVQEADRCMTRA